MHTLADRLPDRHVGACQHPKACRDRSAAGHSQRADPLSHSGACVDAGTCAYRCADANARDLAGSNARSDRRAHGNTRSHFCSYEEAHATACSYRGGNAGTHEKSSDYNALSFHGQ